MLGLTNEQLKNPTDYPYFDVAFHALNKVGEELCGDRVEVYKSEDNTFLVMADGLGSGVKANILATLTVKIAMTMLRNGESLEETIDTIMKTLPVCSVRKVAYSTFCVVHIDATGWCKLIEYHNPPVLYSHKGKISTYPYKTEIYGDKEVRISEMQLTPGDYLTVVSDGAVHAGVGHMLNHGWEWEHIAEYLDRQHPKSAEQVAMGLIDTCNKLYDYRPGDDTTVATIMVKEPQITRVFAGPPENAEKDENVISSFMVGNVKKVVCGGTAAHILSRVTGRSLVTELDYFEPSIPPIAHIKGIDLVTEGVLTLRRLSEMLDTYTNGGIIDFERKDAATLLADLFVNHSTHIELWVGKAINPAHQNPDFPFELSIKLHVVEKLVQHLRQIGKIVTVKYL